MGNSVDDPFGFRVDAWKAKARLMRREAHLLETRAEIWELAAIELEDAIADAAKRGGKQS